MFGAKFNDLALATDFCAILKTFINDGLHPTCFSGIDLFTTIKMFKTLKSGHEDLGRMTRDTVYTREEGAYRKMGSRAFGVAAFNRLNRVKGKAVKGDRRIIVFCAHGQPNSGNLVLEAQNSKERLSKSEIDVTLTGLVTGTQVKPEGTIQQTSGNDKAALSINK